MTFNVLSLFDGISCGQIALERAGIKYDSYYASEIDKYAIQITQNNYSNTIQIGDVCDVKALDLPKIDLLIGGSPCQGFSNSGKGLNFEDPRSKLFFEYVRLLKECKPKYFLLENVNMKKIWIDIISSYLEMKPIKINSALVSAQNRVRLYWTNIPNIKQPEDKKIYLKDIKVGCCPVKHREIAKLYKYETKNYTQFKSENSSWCNSQDQRVYFNCGKFGSLCASGIFGYLNCDCGKIRRSTPIEWERLQTVPDNYTNYVSNNQRYKALGNGWTVDVIAHIFKNLKGNPIPKSKDILGFFPLHEILNINEI